MEEPLQEIDYAEFLERFNKFKQYQTHFYPDLLDKEVEKILESYERICHIEGDTTPYLDRNEKGYCIAIFKTNEHFYDEIEDFLKSRLIFT